MACVSAIWRLPDPSPARRAIAVHPARPSPDPDFGVFDGERYLNRKVGYDRNGVAYAVTDVLITTINGPVNITPGEWIITGIQGEVYPCKPDIFAATYEPV